MTLDSASVPPKPDLFHAIDEGLLGEHGWVDTLTPQAAVPLPRSGAHERRLAHAPKAS